jgi:hypothetical protein
VDGPGGGPEAKSGSSGAATADWPALPDYEVLAELGRGGMGVVYRAQQISLRRIVALKVLSSGLAGSSSAVTRFRKEAQAAAKLHHTNIVPVYAQGEQDGHLYYAMELVEGRNLHHVIQESRPGFAAGESATVSAASHQRRRYVDWARLICGVAEGLEHAHRQGVIHRDIKPQNLLLAADGQLHITDFGLARLLDEPSLTVTGEMVGTPAYMSPEQVNADRRRIDHRTDIYSLGVTFYELLTGGRPFDASSREQLVQQICTREPRPPRKCDPHIPLDLDTICLRAMEKDPARRYPTAGAMAEDLRRFIAHQPIASRRAGPVEKAVKWVRRHPALAAIYALSVLLLAGGITWRVQSVRARHFRARELVTRAFDMLAYEDYREPAASLALLNEAARLGPDEVDYRRALAFAHLRDDKAAAIRDLKRVCEARPDDTDTMYLLAWALRPMRREDEARESRQWISRADALGGAATAAGHFFRGQALIVHDPEEAARSCRAAVGLRRGYTQAMLHLGRAHNFWTYRHRRLEKLGEQKDILGMACQYDSEKAYPRFLLSIAYRFAGEISQRDGNTAASQDYFAQALHFAREAQGKEPGSPRGYAAEAEYWEARRNDALALSARDRGAPYATLSDDRFDLLLYRWRLNYWLGDTRRALADLENLAALADRDDQRRIWFTDLFPALILAEQGRREEAVDRVGRAAAASATSFRAVTSAATALRILGRPDRAERLLADSAAGIDFQTLPASAGLPNWQRISYSICRMDRGWPDLLEMLAAQPDPGLLYAGPRFFLAATELARGDRPAALEHFQAALQTYDWEDYSYLAKVFIRRMETDPAWPPWIAAKPDTAVQFGPASRPAPG